MGKNQTKSVKKQNRKILWINRVIKYNFFCNGIYKIMLNNSQKNPEIKKKCLETVKIIDRQVQYYTCIKHYGSNFASSTLTFERHILNIKGGNIIWNGLTKEVTHYFRTLKDTTAISFWWFECSLKIQLHNLIVCEVRSYFDSTVDVI